MFWLRNKENNFQLPSVIWWPGSNHRGTTVCEHRSGSVVECLTLDQDLKVPTWFVCLFGLILYVPSTIFQLNRDGSSWVEPVLS